MALLSQQSVLSLSRSILQEAEPSLIHSHGNTRAERSCIKDETKCFTWDHFTGHDVFPSSVLIANAHLRPHSPGAAGPAARQVFAGGIFIAVH